MSDIYPFDEPELADKILEDLDDLCTELGLTFYLYAGVVLGFHREGDYIYLDNDIDVAIIANETEYRNLISELVKLGFEQSLIKDYELHHLRRDNILLDLRRADKELPYVVPAGVSTKSYTFQELDTVTHYGRAYKVPGPIEDYLAHSYGSWWIPRLKYE
jgi:phosphorylcholine metabolism protein LicD